MRRILIVEDDATMIAIYEAMFHGKEASYQIVVEKDARMAFLRLAKEKFDLVILDMVMDPMDGETFYSCTRSDERLKGVPIMIVSVLNPANYEHLKKMNNLTFLQKPVEEEQLFRQIENIFSS